MPQGIIRPCWGTPQGIIRPPLGNVESEQAYILLWSTAYADSIHSPQTTSQTGPSANIAVELCLCGQSISDSLLFQICIQ